MSRAGGGRARATGSQPRFHVIKTRVIKNSSNIFLCIPFNQGGNTLTSFTQPINPFNWLQRRSLSDDFSRFWTFFEAHDGATGPTDAEPTLNGEKQERWLLFGSNKWRLPPEASETHRFASLVAPKPRTFVSPKMRNAALMWEVEAEKCDLQTPHLSRASGELQKHFGSDFLSETNGIITRWGGGVGGTVPLRSFGLQLTWTRGSVRANSNSKTLLTSQNRPRNYLTSE